MASPPVPLPPRSWFFQPAIPPLAFSLRDTRAFYLYGDAAVRLPMIFDSLFTPRVQGARAPTRASRAARVCLFARVLTRARAVSVYALEGITPLTFPSPP